MPRKFSDRPTHEEYVDWYEDLLGDNLESGSAEQWFERVTDAGSRVLEGSEFWQALQKTLNTWNASFEADHDGYPLLGSAPQPKRIGKKTFKSVLIKSFRWNVLENSNWPDPPVKSPSTASKYGEHDPHDPKSWFGPHNWLSDFPDIFRTRLTTSYFDGVNYLARRVMELADHNTEVSPHLRLRASLEGHHAVHLWVYHQLDTYDYEYGDPVCVPVRLEVQITTTIQSTISEMLHRVYDDWRLNGTPPGWEWDLRDPGFSVNYLGSTLHYLEGMIVVARDNVGTN